MTSRGKLLNPTDPGFDVVAILGQSNALGSGEGVDLTYLDVTDPRIKQWPGSGSYLGQAVTAVDPLFGYSQAVGVGAGMQFAREYVKSVPGNRSVLLANCALGSTGFTPSGGFTWDPADTTTTVNLYNYSVTQITAALAANAGSRLLAIIWQQGEADTTSLNQAQYAAKLDALIAGLRTAFGASVPFLVGQMNPDRFSFNAGYPLVNAAEVDTPRRNLRSAFAYGTSGQSNSVAGGGTIHYNAAGQRYMGRQLFAALTLARANVLLTAPVTPGAVTVTQVGTTVNVTWVRTAGRVTDYNVRYSTNGGTSWTALTRAQNIDNTAAITGQTLGSTVTVEVQTVNEQGVSAWTAPVAVALVNLPGAVTGLTAGTITGTSTVLSWTAASGAADYLIEKSIDGGTTYTTVATISPATSYTITGLNYSTAYTMRVTAQTAAGNGTPATVAMTTSAPNALASDVGVSLLTGHGTRKLVTAYAGSCMTVRRSSDNTTQAIGFLTNGELDTASLLTFCGAGNGFVNTWYDQSGNGKDLVQSTTASQPQIVAAGIVNKVNNKPALLFSATQFFNLASGFGMYAAGHASVLGVYTSLPVGGVASQCYLCESNSGGQSKYDPLYVTSSNVPAAIGGNDAGVTLFSDVGSTAITGNGALHQVSFTDTGSAISVWADAAAQVSAVAYTRSTTTINRTVVGGQIQGAATTTVAPVVGSICEIATFNVALTTGQRQAGEANQKIEYATP